MKKIVFYILMCILFVGCSSVDMDKYAGSTVVCKESSVAPYLFLKLPDNTGYANVKAPRKVYESVNTGDTIKASVR